MISSIVDAVGRAPPVCLSNVSSGNVYAKAEYLNPGGSIKDRVAKCVIESAMGDKVLKPGTAIIQATSGKTGIGPTLVGVL